MTTMVMTVPLFHGNGHGDDRVLVDKPFFLTHEPFFLTHGKAGHMKNAKTREKKCRDTLRRIASNARISVLSQNASCLRIFR